DDAQSLIGTSTKLPTKPNDEVEFGERDALHFPWRLTRLQGTEERYLTVNYRPRSSPIHRLFNIYSGIMMLSIFIGSLVSLALLFFSMRSKSLDFSVVVNQLLNCHL